MDFDTAPYWDDAAGANGAIAKDYVRVLFRPGYAVQARELTQIQSMFQDQIQNMGDFLFQNGSPVSGGHITFNNTVQSIQLQANDNVNLSDYDGELVINSVGPTITRAVVVAIDDSLQSNLVAGALIVKYLSGDEFNDGDTLQLAVGTQEAATLVTSNSSSRASVASINPGVFYVDGFFVAVPEQTIVLDPLDPSPSFRVGLVINDSIVDESQDSTLLDPAQGSFNYQAPGATRYQYSLSLDKRTLDSTDDSQFFELLRIENGIITKQVEYPILGNIIDELAARTYDQSGDFTVTPFLATTSDDSSNTQSFILSVGAGKGYVKGYEFQTIAPVKISIPKALSTNTSTDYNLSLEYGNYVAVTNLYSGNVAGFNTGNFGSLDLHIVPSANINTTSASAYANTKIGTTKIRDIEYDGVNTYLAYLLEVAVTPIVVNAAGVSANTLSVSLPSSFTAYANAIANVPVTVISGNSSGDVRTIVGYNASTKVGIFNRQTTQLLDTTSQLSIGFAAKDINSIVGSPGAITGNVYATQNATSGQFPCMDISVNGGKDTLGNTVIFNTDLNRLDFSLPQSFVKQASFTNVSFFNRKSLNTVTFTGGNTTIGTGTGLDSSESYAFGFTSSYLPDTIAHNNFLVVVRDKQTSNLSNGQVIIFDHGINSAGNGIFQTDSTHVTIDTVTVGNFIGDILVTVLDSNASVNYRRAKTLTGNTARLLLSTDRPNNGLPFIGTVNANSKFLDAANGMVWSTSYPDIIKTPGQGSGLGIADVVQIIAIYDSGNASFYPNTTNAIDITSNYLFSSGQKDNYYDHGSITLRDGASPPSGQTVVLFQYYAHDSTTGFFSADSYSSDDYANLTIPTYISERFGAVELRDCIDFRPTRTSATQANVKIFTINGLRLPQPDNPMTLTYDFYLPRIDKLVLTKNQQFNILSGTPALLPEVPADTSDSMTLYTITIPQYTAKAANVSLAYSENKRYTFRDIGALDNRITQLEDYTALTAMESSATQTSILYQDGATAKEQYGIITDTFVDFSVADTDNPDLVCNLGSGNLLPYKQHTPIEFRFASATGPFFRNDRTFSLAFTEESVVVQNTATNGIQIQPYAFGQFKGDIILRPQTDFWYSDLIPQIVAPPQKPVPLPPPPAPKPVIPPSVIGVVKPPVVVPSKDVNKANLVPATVTHVPTIKVPPPAGKPAPAAVVNYFTYCYPLSGFGINPLNGSFGYYNIGGVIVPNDTILNNQPFLGSGCIRVEKTASGYGILRPDGNWYPATSLQTSLITEASSQSKAAPPTIASPSYAGRVTSPNLR